MQTLIWKNQSPDTQLAMRSGETVHGIFTHATRLYQHKKFRIL
jgi:hypothetical protein